MGKISERVLDENGRFVDIAKPQSGDPKDRDIAVLKKQIDQMKVALNQKKDEILSIKQAGAEANPLMKEKIIGLEKEVAKLRLEIEVFVEKEKGHEIVASRVIELEDKLKNVSKQKGNTKNK